MEFVDIEFGISRNSGHLSLNGLFSLSTAHYSPVLCYIILANRGTMVQGMN